VSSASQVPPQNVDMEESVLGAMLVAEPILARVIDEVRLHAGDFYLDKHRLIFSAISDLYAASKPVDELSVIEALTQRPTINVGGSKVPAIEAAGGKHYVSELAAKVPAAGNAKHYAEIVQKKSRLRDVIAATQAAQVAAFAGTLNGEVDHLLETLEGVKVSESALRRDDSSWAPVDLDAALEGITEAKPTILRRSDGVCLLYDERIHQVAAEPEACKGWFAVKPAADLIAAGCTVAYIDFEATAAEIVERFKAFGITEGQIRDRLIYVRPHEPVVAAAFEAVLARNPALVVFDGVTEALTIHGLSLEDNADVARWLELAPRPAVRTGAAVLLIDHVKKDKDSRGRYAIGAQHKLAGIDVSYGLEVVTPFGRGREGVVKVKVFKDRPGHVRRHEVDGEIALMRLISADDGSVKIDFEEPDSDIVGEEFQPTHLMQKVSDALLETPGMTARDIRALGGKGSTIDLAIRLLVKDGFVEIRPEGSAKKHYSQRPFIDQIGGAW
jgi:hypothetical protein